MKIRNTYIDGNTIGMWIVGLMVLGVLAAPGQGSSLARVCASAGFVLIAHWLDIEIDAEAWVSTLTW